MAAADYYLCDSCECKTFYDAELNYDQGNENPETHHLWPNGNIGFMKVLCKSCASKNEETAPSASSNSVSMAIAQLVTDFITNHDLTDIQSITMHNFLDWVALQHT